MYRPALLAANLVAAAAGVVAAPSGVSSLNQSFKLETKLRCSDGNPAYNGLFVSGIMEGAATLALTAVSGSSSAQDFNLTDGNLEWIINDYAVGSDVLFVVDPTDAPPENNTAPAGYYEINFDGYGEPPSTSDGFFFDQHGYLTTKENSFKTFAVCNVSYIDPYAIYGPQKQLLWSSIFHEDTKDGQCADVELYPKFLSS